MSFPSSETVGRRRSRESCTSATSGPEEATAVPRLIVGSVLEARPDQNRTSQPRRSWGGSLYSTWDKGCSGGDTVAAVQANWPGGGVDGGQRGEWERRWGPTGTMLP